MTERCISRVNCSVESQILGIRLKRSFANCKYYYLGSPRMRRLQDQLDFCWIQHFSNFSQFANASLPMTLTESPSSTHCSLEASLNAPSEISSTELSGITSLYTWSNTFGPKQPSAIFVTLWSPTLSRTLTSTSNPLYPLSVQIVFC